VVDEAEDTARHFTQDDLRQLFEFKDTECDTHDTFKCKRCKGGKQFVKAPALLYGDSSTYVESLSLLFFILLLLSFLFPLSSLFLCPWGSILESELMIDGIISLIQNWARCTMIS
jgi:hypothetical protein